MKSNMNLSGKAQLKNYTSGERIEFMRLREGFDESEFKTLKVFGTEVWMNFDWGSNEGLTPTQRPATDIDQMVARELVLRGLFHLRNKVGVRVLPAVHKRLGAYTSYSSKVLVFERVRPQ